MTIRAFVIAIVLSWSAFAAADLKDDARAHVRTADTHYKLGRFQEALDEYGKAYELFAAPPLLFNIGQCHRNLKNWERAIFFLEGYLREVPAAANRALVEDLIREAQEQLARQREAGKRADDERLAIEQARAAENERLAAVERERAADAERLRFDQEARAAAARHADDGRMAALRDNAPRGRRHFYSKWWFWTAVGGVAIAAGGSALLLSKTKLVPPAGSTGTLDRQ